MNGESIVLRQDENRKAKAPRANLQSAPSSPLRRYAPLGVVLALLGISWVTGLLDYFSLSSLIMHRDALREFVEGNLFTGLVGYVVIYALLVAISFPGASLLTIAAGFVFGGILGGGATVIGATLGASTIFQIARTSLGKTMQERTGKFVARLRSGFQEDAFHYLLMLRLTPVFPFWVINIVPALLGMKLLPYAAATFLGIIPGTFAYAYIGAGLDSVIAAQEAANPGCAAAGTCEIDPGSLVTTDVIVAMVTLGLISLLPVVIKKIRGRPLSQ